MHTLESLIQNSASMQSFQNQLSIQVPDSNCSFDQDDSSSHYQSDAECTPIKKVVCPSSTSSQSSSSNTSFRYVNIYLLLNHKYKTIYCGFNRDDVEIVQQAISVSKPSFIQNFNSTPMINYSNQSLIRIVKRKPTVNFHCIDDLVNGNGSTASNLSNCNDSGNYSSFYQSSQADTSHSFQNVSNETSNQEANEYSDDKENAKSMNKCDNKKFRTSFTDEQKKQLDNYFIANPYPDPKETEEMSAHLGLTENVIKVWFQNKRSRDKQRKFSRENNARLAAKKQLSNEQLQTSPLISNLQFLSSQIYSLKAAAALNAFASNMHYPHY